MNYITAWQDDIKMTRVEETGVRGAVSAEKTDSQLIELVLCGEETAFENLFDRYKRLVASIASRYFRNHEQIDEIIQITFAQIYFQLKYFRGAQDFSFASWIGKITTNACLDALRSQKRKPENLLCEFSEPETEILFAAASNNEKTVENLYVQRDLAEKLLSHLTDEDRAILQMLDAEEMSVSEVSEITGWSNSKIKIRAFRARNALRKVLRKFL
jgi:RNA polymerase sigma-70 factor (ECF subfamily)